MEATEPTNTPNQDECPNSEPPKKGKTKPKKEIDDLGEINAEGMQELEEKLKTMKVSKKLKKKLLMEEAERQKFKVYDPNVHCFKCKEREGVMVNRGDKACEPCFNESCIHRFKTNLRTNLKIWKDDSNLICVSGGPNSMAMLHLMYISLFGDAKRKMFFKVHIVYIDESAVFSWDEAKATENRNIVIDACKQFNFEYTILKIESVFDIKLLNPNAQSHESNEEEKRDHVNQVIEASEGSLEKLQELIKHPSKLCSNREDLIFYLKKWVLLDFALKYGFTKLLLGCSALSITSKVMSEIAKGRGLSLPNDVSFVDDRYLKDIKFMNPMRDYLMNEIEYYNQMSDIKTIEQSPLCETDSKKGKKLPGFGSMNLLCEGFIKSLQDSNVQTVHTILRTSAKLKIGIVEDQEKNFCVLCYGLVDHATNILEVGSNIKSITLDGQCDLMDNERDTWNTDFEQHLCFGCKRIMENADDKTKLIESLPKFILDNAEGS